MLAFTDAVQLIVRLTLAAYILPSGVGKLRHRTEFLEAMSNYRILSPPAAAIFGALLPWIEIAVGGALLIGAALPLTGVSLLVMLILFLTSMLINIRRSRLIECGCYGIAGTARIGWGAVARNLMLAALALALISLSVNRSEGWLNGVGWGIDAALTSLPDLASILTLSAFGVVMISLVEWFIHVMTHAAAFAGIRFE